MTGSVRTWRAPAGPAASTWQLRPWPNDPAAALLVFVDHLTVPSPDDFDTATRQARATGAQVLRTSALFPRATEVALTRGFVTLDTLCLLRLTLDDSLDQRLESRFGGAPQRTRQMRPRHHARVAQLDRDAFGDLWGNDDASLADIRAATPRHRARMRVERARLLGFAMCGAGGTTGYVQRVAVASDARRGGVASALVGDGLMWMRRQRLTLAYVNTGFDNAPAMSMYEGLGFERTGDSLTIVERRLDT